MTEKILICSWFWEQPGGRAQYNRDHIEIWASMVRRNVTIPHRIGVVTHEDIAIDGVEVIRPPRDFDDVRIPSWGEKKPQCLRRLVMFRPDAARWFGRRFVSMDLDLVVGGSLDPIFTRDEDIVLFKGTHRSRPYNGSLLMMTAGARPAVYTDFTPERAAEAGKLFCGSDQAWLMHKLGPNEATWDERDGVYWFGGPYRRRAKVSTPRILFYPGAIKPWDATLLDRFTREHYRIELKEAA